MYNCKKQSNIKVNALFQGSEVTMHVSFMVRLVIERLEVIRIISYFSNRMNFISTIRLIEQMKFIKMYDRLYLIELVRGIKNGITTY